MAGFDYDVVVIGSGFGFGCAGASLGTMAVAVAIGSILPKLTQLPIAPYIGLGAGYAALSIWSAPVGEVDGQEPEHAT